MAKKKHNIVGKIAVKCIALILAGLMVLSVGGTLIYYLFMI